ncbi:MAG TPA: dephospho-CoA kinase, partial [Clostridia bacterium]|nr:dephospho-CoA kinase [Clostridia bacterium]
MKFLVIGLTGQTGAGKSTLARRLAEEGFPIIDADIAAREIVAVGSPLLNELAEVFGRDIIGSNGSLDRRLLASRAFASKANTKKINRITHPAITTSIKNKIEAAQKNGARAVVIDAAVLLESGLAEECDIIAVVTAPFDIRLERIMQRDGLSEDEALK